MRPPNARVTAASGYLLVLATGEMVRAAPLDEPTGWIVHVGSGLAAAVILLAGWPALPVAAATALIALLAGGGPRPAEAATLLALPLICMVAPAVLLAGLRGEASPCAWSRPAWVRRYLGWAAAGCLLEAPLAAWLLADPGGAAAPVGLTWAAGRLGTLLAITPLASVLLRAGWAGVRPTPPPAGPLLVAAVLTPLALGGAIDLRNADQTRFYLVTVPLLIAFWGAEHRGAAIGLFVMATALEALSRWLNLAQPTVFEARLFVVVAGTVAVAMGALVAESRQTAAELGRTELRYRELFEAVGEGVIVHDLDTGRPVECNARACELTGLDRETILSMTSAELMMATQFDGEHPPESGLASALRAIDHGPQLNEWPARRADTGEPFWIEAVVRYSDLGGRRRMIVTFRDITERKRGELERQVLAERYREIFDGSREGIVIHDLETLRPLDCNARACEMFGLPREELLAQTTLGLSRLVSAAADGTTDRLAEALIPLALTEGPQTFEHTVRRVDTGEVRWVEASVQITTINHRRRLVSAVRDITERKEAEAARQHADARYRELFATSRDAIFINDLQTLRPIDCNQRAEEMFGRGREELLERSVPELAADHSVGDPFGAEAAMAVGLRAASEGPQLVEWRARRADTGAEFWMEAAAQVTQIGEQQRLILTFRDITERKEAELAVIETQTMLRTVLDNIPVRVLWKDTNFVYQGCNRAFCLDNGLASPEAVVGMTDDQICTPEDVERFHDDDREVMVSRTPRLQYEEPRTKPDGQLTWLRTSKVPMIAADGEVAGVLLIYDDITEQKRIENAIRERERRLAALFEASPAGILTLDDQGRVQVANSALGELFGVPTAELIGRRYLDLVAPGERTDAVQRMASQRVSKEPYAVERRYQRDDGTRFWGLMSGRSLEDIDGLPIMLAFLADISLLREQQAQLTRSEAVARALLALNQMTDATLDELTAFVLEEAVGQTESQIGYLAFMNDDETVLRMHAWSQQAMAECRVEHIPWEFVVAETGLWGEAARRRQPVITNDYAAFNPLKKGTPPGHIAITRHLNVPVIADGKVVAVAGVANKDEPYDDADVRQLQLMMDGMWRMVERRRAQEALAASEQTFREFFSNLALGGALHELVYDDDGRPVDYSYLEVNAACGAQGGRDPESVRGQTARGMYGEAPFLETYVEVVQTGEPRRFEATFEPLGRIYDVLAIRTEPGRFATLFEDVTERRRNEEALAERTRFTNAVADTLPGILFVGEVPSLATVYVNEAVTRYSRRTVDEVLSGEARIVEDVHPDDVPSLIAFGEAVAQAADGEVVQIEYRLIGPDGEYHWHNIWSKVFARDAEGRVTQFLGIALDVSDRRRAQQELLEQNRLVNSIAETLPGLLFVTSLPDMDNVYINRGIETLLGYPPEAISSGAAKFAEVMHPDDRDLLTRYAASAAAAGDDTIFEQEYRVRGSSGEYRWLNSWNRVFARDEHGTATQVLGISLDLTERRQAEEELRQRNEEMMRFTYTVSHDLRSPLVTIKTFLGYLVDDLGKNDAQRIESDVAYMRQAADRMSDLLDELLELSRVGRKVNPPETVRVAALLEEARALTAGRLTDRGIVVAWEGPHVEVTGDRPRLVELYQNLLDNAAKFSGDQPDPRIVAGAERRGDELVLFVRDNGIGVEPRYLERLFGLFEKLDTASEGTGIGLALVRRIVEVHGGRIWAESRGLGSGTTIWFTLASARALDTEGVEP